MYYYDMKERRLVGKAKPKKRIIFSLFILLVAIGYSLVNIGVFGVNIPRGTATEDYIIDEQGNPILISAEDRKDNFFTVLVVGADEAGGQTDTIMIASIDIENESYSLMSIPRDTMANVRRSNKKINAAVPSGGIKQLKNELFDIIGFNVDRYVYIELDAFESIIDALGGVEVDVPMRMRYNDPYQGLHIDLQPGVQVLDGEKALHFVRFRSGYPDADLGRIKAQQGFISAVIKQMSSPMSFFRVPGIIMTALGATETDLTNGELVWLANKLRDASLEQVSMHVIPGMPAYHDNLSYYVVNEKESLELINEKFNPYTREIVSLNLINSSSQNRSTPRPTAEHFDPTPSN